MAATRTWIALVFAFACGGSPPKTSEANAVSTSATPAPATSAALAPPPHVNIRFFGATIAPTKMNGAPWDGIGAVPPGVVSAVGKALSLSNPYVAVAEALAPLINSGMQPPDVAGRIDLLSQGISIAAFNLTKIQDNYAPEWSPPAAFDDVTLDERVSLQIYFVDKDAIDDDPIGTVLINSAQLRGALENHGQLTHVRVDDQNRQILFINIAVFAR
jgi:hypothetical protein